jgi:hypothetical protein
MKMQLSWKDQPKKYGIGDEDEARESRRQRKEQMKWG